MCPLDSKELQKGNVLLSDDTSIEKKNTKLQTRHSTLVKANSATRTKLSIS